MKILMIDRDAVATAHLERQCRSILNGRLERFETVTSVADATSRLAESPFDLLLLDPPAGRDDGLELAGMTARSYQTIVVSARTDLALRAFECGVLDFVLKPAGPERLAQALQRAQAPAKPAAQVDDFIAVRRLGRIDLVPLNDLLYVEGADKYSELVLANGQRNFYDQGLAWLEAKLPGAFVRIHKSYLVRFAMVSRLRVLKGSRYFAELKNGLRLPVGRSRYQQIKAQLI